tara:strand:+ start:1185 stop:1325 length:141 start_codon:yes stop_codon:yes gene_type:complete
MFWVEERGIREVLGLGYVENEYCMRAGVKGKSTQEQAGGVSSLVGV